MDLNTPWKTFVADQAMEPDKLRELGLLVDGLGAFGKSIGVWLRADAPSPDCEWMTSQYESLYGQARKLLGDERLQLYAPRFKPTHTSTSTMLWPDDAPGFTVSVAQLYNYAKTVFIMEVERAKPTSTVVRARFRVFIAHGRESTALTLTRDLIAALGLEPVIAEESASLGKSVDAKVREYMAGCQAAVILATGDEVAMGSMTMQPRQNVIHEIGLAQEILKNRVNYWLEENTQFPSNIAPKVYERFTKHNLTKAFIALARDLKAFGLL